MKHLFIVGAQRSGSTYLYQLLDSHPQVNMAKPVRPEPKFFLKEDWISKGRAYYEKTCFTDKPDKNIDIKYLGEKSTSYFEIQLAAQRIQHFSPDARILIILRDPVLRAYSNYRFSVANKLETLNFDEALAAEVERLSSAAFTTSVTPYAYRKRGHYMDYIESYLQIFNPNQICVLIFEEFVNNLDQVQSLYRWLGLDEGFVPPSLDQVINPADVKMEDQQTAFRDLARGYQGSIARLERWLGRRIDVWQEHHHALLSGAST